MLCYAIWASPAGGLQFKFMRFLFINIWKSCSFSNSVLTVVKVLFLIGLVSIRHFWEASCTLFSAWEPSFCCSIPNALTQALYHVTSTKWQPINIFLFVFTRWEKVEMRHRLLFCNETEKSWALLPLNYQKTRPITIPINKLVTL